MPLHYARSLIGHRRSGEANRQLGLALAFVAGAINAGGLLAVGQYTSHMTGIVSATADHLALGNGALVLSGIGALLSFLLGAMLTALMVNYARRRQRHSTFALPLLLEALLLLAFGLLGSQLSALPGLFVPATVMLLCFIMGLQNALVTKLSRAEIRTTHVTGLVTDIGIELGKALYVNRRTDQAPVRVNRARLTLLTQLLTAFFAGGVLGALGFKQFGFLATVPPALVLIAFALVPASDDLRRWWRRRHAPAR